MTCSPFHALCADLSDPDETFEQFYPEDSKFSLGMLGCRIASRYQLKYEHGKYPVRESAVDQFDTDDRASIGSSPLTPPATTNRRFFCPDEIDLTSWTNKHPEQWGPREVLDWVYYVADKCQISGIRGEMFNQKTGSELCRFTREQFMHLEPNYGGLLQECLHQLLRNSNFRPPNHWDIVTSTNVDYETIWPSLTPVHEPTSHHFHASKQAEVAVKLNGTVYDIDLKESFVDIKEEPVWSREWSTEVHYTPRNEQPAFRDTRDPRLPSQELFEGATELRTWGRSPGRPRKGSNDSFDGEGSFRTPPGRRPGHVSKGNHLWEFVRDLLANPVYNPSLVRWEDEANGVFRFVQSEKVAKLWGEKKNNSKMTYEKLSRAMRFCRSAGHFAVLPKSERFPKKLCFKFGPKALTWRGA